MVKRFITGLFIAAGITSSCYAESANEWPDSSCWLVVAALFFSMALRELSQPQSGEAG